MTSAQGIPQTAGRCPSGRAAAAVLYLALLLTLIAGGAACGPAKTTGESSILAPREVPQPPSDYLVARRKARDWLGRLVLDTARLQKAGIKSKKKLAELLTAYLYLYRHSRFPEERQKLLKRVRSLVEQTRKPGFHDMTTCSDRVFGQNSLSYLRIPYLMRDFGLDTTGYLREVRLAKTRLDEHAASRGPSQEVMLAHYYDALGLEKPPALRKAALLGGIIAGKTEAWRFDTVKTYLLTHEVFAAFRYGDLLEQDMLSAKDLAHVRPILAPFLKRAIRHQDPDLAAELLTGMTFLGLRKDPAFQEGIAFLLKTQNPDGSWGDYEKHRADYGEYLEVQFYLHTTMVALQALTEAIEGNWPN